MLSAIEFNHDPLLKANKVDDEASDWLLSPELQTIELLRLELTPEERLCFRRVSAEDLGISCKLSAQCLDPPPLNLLPLPRARDLRLGRGKLFILGDVPSIHHQILEFLDHAPSPSPAGVPTQDCRCQLPAAYCQLSPPAPCPLPAADCLPTSTLFSRQHRQ
jgi:hypothetical protein